ncbi:autotransporter domain-containing protein [Rickettsia typhi]|nr:autotransporter domain-containing protein [Rickettsia typhi]
MQFSQSLEVPTPTGEFGKKYSKLINPKTSKQNLKIEFPKKIISLVRDELTLKYFTADIERILTLFSKKDDLILSEAKEKYKEVIQDPYIAQFTNKNQNTGSFLENKLFEETREEAILRLLSLEQLDAQMKKEILSKQGDILEQLKFINANTEILGSYGQTASTDILKKIPKELPKILSKQGDILEQLKFINANTEILNEHSKAILKDKLKELSKQLDEISSNQLVGFILDENKINTNLKNVHFSEKKVRETVSNLNNKILEKIFLKDDGTITEQDLTKILQKHQETVLIKNLTKAIVYIDGNKNNATVNKTLEKCLEQTTPEQQELILDVLTHNTRIRTVLITKIEREQRQNHNKKLNKNIAGDSFVDALKKALVHRTSNSETILKVVEQRKQETPKNLNVWDRISQNIPNLNNQNVQDENNKEWDESNKNADDLNNTNIYMITKHDLERAVNETITKFSAMSTLLKDKKNAGAYQRYLKEAEDQLALAQEKGKELIKNSAQTFKIIPKKYQDDINENWQNYLSPAEMIELTALNEHTNTLKSNKNKSGHFRSSEEALQYKAKQHEYYTLLAELKKIGIAKQQEKLVKDYVDEMITNAKQAVEKFERTSLEHINQKKENKQISKEILDAQERLENAKQKIEFIKFKYIISNKRQVNSSDEDSDDDADKNAIKQKTELENAQKDINQAKKNLEDAKAKYAALQITLNYSPNGMDSKTTEDQEQFKTDNIAAESLEDMAVMFKDSEEAAERKEEVTLNYSPNGMDSKTTEDQEQFKTDNIAAESLEDMAVMFKDSEEAAERKEEVTLNYSPNGMDSKTTEDQEQFKTDNIAAESLEDMAVMFKDSEEAAERKEEVTLDYSPNGMDSKTTEDQEQFKTDNIAAESLEDMAVMFKDSEEAAERKEEVTLNYSPNGMDSKTTEDQEQFKTDNIAAESLEDMAVMFKDSEEAAERKEEVTLNYSPNGMDSKTTEDQEQFKTDNIAAESLEDMAVMFKDSEEAAERKEEVTLDYSPNGMDSKTTEDQEQFKTDNIAAESLEDMAVMFKDSEEAAERKEEVTLDYSPNGMDSKTTEDQEQFKTDNIAAESLEDMAVMFKDSEEAAERKEEVTLNYSPNGMDSKTTEDQEQFKTDNIAAESLEDMAVMFKDSEEAAEQKEEVNRQHHEEQNRQKQEHNCLDTEEEVVHKEKIADLTAETETKVFKKEIALEENEAMDVSFKTETIVEQDEAIQRQQVSDDTSRKVAILVKATSTLHKPVHHNILSDRLKVTVIGAGDEKTNINRGLWISGLYGVNKQGSWKNIPKYQGRTTGFTIGADAEFINNHDVIGIAYSNLESKIKYNKKLGKTAVYGHLLSIYGLKELIPGFSLHTIVSYGYNYIKNKSKNLDKIIGKYQNNNLSFQTLLNYKYCTKYNLHFIPSIGFKYDYSRASNYKEYNIDIENLMIQKKSNQSFESSIGGKIVSKPIIITNNTILTLSVHGNIERHFNNKNTKVNAKATFKKQTLQETIIIPKQPKFGYNIGNNILMSIKNINVLYEYNYYTHKKYHSHQGLIKLKINL